MRERDIQSQTKEPRDRRMNSLLSRYRSAMLTVLSCATPQLKPKVKNAEAYAPRRRILSLVFVAIFRFLMV
jgi:hypothetical protein